MTYGKDKGFGAVARVARSPSRHRAEGCSQHLAVQKSGSRVGPGPMCGSRKRTVPSQRNERIVLKATCAPIHSVGAHHEMNIPREEPLRISPPRLGPGDQRGPESALLKVTQFCPPHSNFLGMGSEGKRRKGLQHLGHTLAGSSQRSRGTPSQSSANTLGFGRDQAGSPLSASPVSAAPILPGAGDRALRTSVVGQLREGAHGVPSGPYTR